VRNWFQAFAFTFNLYRYTAGGDSGVPGRGDGQGEGGDVPGQAGRGPDAMSESVFTFEAISSKLFFWMFTSSGSGAGAGGVLGRGGLSSSHRYMALAHRIDGRDADDDANAL
jgi:hypothetical protein